MVTCDVRLRLEPNEHVWPKQFLRVVLAAESKTVVRDAWRSPMTSPNRRVLLNVVSCSRPMCRDESADVVHCVGRGDLCRLATCSSTQGGDSGGLQTGSESGVL